MKALAVPLIVFFFFTVASLPFILLDARKAAGKFLRANSLLIAMAIAWYADENMGKKPSMILFTMVVVFSLAFLKQAIERRGLPILESVAGVAIFKSLLSVTDSQLISSLLTGIAVYLIASLSAKKFPIRSHHADND